jgi:hypothetical protein
LVTSPYNLPQSFANPFPRFQPAVLQSQTATLTTKASVREVYDCYVAKLEAQGWKVSATELRDLRTVNFEKDSLRGVVIINPGDFATNILIVISGE